MTKYVQVAQITVALSVVFVWIFRYDNIIKEFKSFGLSDFTRSFIGALKISLATLLIFSIWYPAPLTISAVLMGAIMVAAQYFHFKIKNPLFKHLPSFILLLLCVFITLASIGKI